MKNHPRPPRTVRSALWSLAKPLLFSLEPEHAHSLSLHLTRFWGSLGNFPLRVLSGAHTRQPRIGLAAGFDKNAEWLPYLPAFGFGFAEIGTVTPRPQGGNDRPRLFRDPPSERLFNRMGFNNLGAAIVAQRIAKHRPGLPADFKIGINLGKNKTTPNDEAARDYADAAKPFAGLVDYVALNVSSPNTPGLRALQSGAELTQILESVLKINASWKQSVPIYIKLAPELDSETLSQLIQTLARAGASGFILTNTWGGELSNPASPGEILTGGWSGRNLTDISLSRLKIARAATSLKLISVGGIMDIESARHRWLAGADALQLYSGWIYRGPSFVPALGIALKDELGLDTEAPHANSIDNR